MSSRRNSLRLTCAALTLVCGLAASCAPTSTNWGLSPADKLSVLATHEATREDRASGPTPPLPPGVPADLFDTRADLDPARARLSLDAALSSLGPGPDPKPAKDVAAPSAPLLLSAQRLYTRGRAALVAGQTAEAGALFEQVVAIDPQAGPAWEGLGLVRSTLGDAAGSARAWRETLRFDPTNVRALEQLGVGALQRQENAEALGLLVRAMRASPQSVDPALPFIIGASLSEALQREGYTLAAAEAAERAASIPAPFTSPTTEQRRLLALFRQRSMLLRDAGDLRLALGDAKGAADAYNRALSLDDTPDASTAARAIAAYQRRGAEASAANALIQIIDATGGRVDSLHIRLVEHVARTTRSTAVARAFAETVREAPARASWPDTPSARSAAVRLAAAAEKTDAGAGRVLLSHLVGGEVDDAATEQLARTLADRPTELAGALVSLVKTHPAQAPQLTSLFARSARDRGAFSRALASTRPSTGVVASGSMTDAEAGALAHAWLLLRTGDAPEAIRRAGPLRSSPAAGPFASLCMIEAFAATGQSDDALATLLALRSGTDPVARMMAGAGDAHLQRHDDALGMLLPLLGEEHQDAPWRADALLFAARSAAATGQIDNAERWLRAALDLQPLREDPYAGLIQIYLATDPQRTRAQLSDTVRRLRENIPSSRTLRILQARELASQGQPDAAGEILLDLLSLDENDAAAAEQYVATLVGAGRAEVAERWLASRLRGPGALAAPDARVATLLLLARVYASTSRVELAIETLESSLEDSPRSEAMLRALEELYRGSLRDEDRANEYALRRLQIAPPTLDNTLELAEARARRGEWAESVEALERALSRPGVSLRRDQRERAARTIVLFAASAEALSVEQARLGADGASMLIDDTPNAPEPLHRARLVLLIRAQAPIGELLSASEAPARTNADFALQLRVAALDMLASGGRAADALRAAAEGYRIAGRPSPEVLAAWGMLALDQGNGAEALRAVRTAIESDAAERTYDTLARLTGGTDNAQGSPADLAYHMAQLFDFEQLDQDAEALYMLALEYDPNHPWACNNFGYRLAERGEDLLRSYDLIQRAYAAMPNATAIVDSMGWVRYRVGIFEDKQAPDGRRVEGAITLLRRAAASSTEIEDAVIHDHLGDAYWRAGERERAIAAWRIAVGMNNSMIELYSERAQENPRVAQRLDRVREERDATSAKIEAAERYAETGVAPNTPEVFPELRDDALRIAPPAIEGPRPGRRNEQPAGA